MVKQKGTQQTFVFAPEDVTRIVELLEIGAALAGTAVRLADVLLALNKGTGARGPEPRPLPVDVVTAIAAFSMQQHHRDGGPEYGFSAPNRHDRAQEAAQ